MLAFERGWTNFDLPLLYVVGGLGPGIEAYVVLRVLRGREAEEASFGALLRWRVGIGWYAAALSMFVVIWLAATVIAGDLDAELAALGPWSASWRLWCATPSQPSPRSSAGAASPYLRCR